MTQQPSLPGLALSAHTVPFIAVDAAAALICGHIPGAGFCLPCSDLAARALAAGITAMDPQFTTCAHELVVGRWHLQHPLSCRNQGTCRVHEEIAALDHEGLLPSTFGSYTITRDDEDGDLLVNGRHFFEDVQPLDV